MFDDEQGWREASDPKNPRYSQKQRGIRNTIKKMQQNTEAAKERHEQGMDADYLDAALEVAHKMRGDSLFGYSRRYAANWDKAFKGD
jgi:hypothetical protein